MATKYRIGTTVGITINISNMPSETANMFVRSEYGTFDMDNVAVLKDSEGNPIGISGKFASANQKYVGIYDVIVISSTKRLCVDNAFELVKHSDEKDEDAPTVLTFDVSYLTCSTVVSGYEEWRQTHDGTIEDYWLWIRDEPRLQQIEKDIQKNKDDIEAEIERATAAETTLQSNIDVVSKDLADEIKRSTETDEYLDTKHSKGKIFCNGILEYEDVPSEDGYYLQKDIDGDISLFVHSVSGEVQYLNAPIGKLFVVDDNLYVRDAFKIIPIGYTDTIIEVATPMTDVGDVDYIIEGNNLDVRSKKIELTSIK